MPQQPVNDVMLILERDGAVCLAERRGTGYADGMLNLPSGKVEPGESVYDAVIREAHEEVGVTVERDALRIVHAMHFRNPEGEPRVGWFLTAPPSAGRPPCHPTSPAGPTPVQTLAPVRDPHEVRADLVR